MKKFFCLVLALMIAFSSIAIVFADEAPTTAEAKTKSGFTSIDDLNGHLLGVQTSVLYEELVKDRIPEAEWQYFTMPNDMILALESNKISAYLIEEVGFIAQYDKHPELVRMEELAGVCDYAVVVGNNERQNLLLSQINEFIAESSSNGFLDDLYDYWVMNFDADTSVIRSNPVFTGENGTVSIAIEGGYEPFSFESNGEFSGFDVEFMQNFCAKYGYIPEFNSIPFEAIAPGTETGKYDFGMNIVISDEREETAQLSNPYYHCNIVFVLEGYSDSDLGFFEKISESFNKTFIKENRWKQFVEGTLVSIEITFSSIVLGTILGFLAYMACRKGNKFANKVTEAITWIIDGMPTVLLLMILYYLVLNAVKMNGIGVSIVGFSLIFACSMYDMLNVGCNAVGKEQYEASRAMGYSDKQAFFRVILPQAARHFIPIYGNDAITLLKETAIVGYIAVLDLTKISDLVRSRTYEAFFPLIATAIIYYLLEILLTVIVNQVQYRCENEHRNKRKILEGIKTDEEFLIEQVEEQEEND
ncbi:MAG: ABC transporter substrate-binding protein/permease [Bacillota bacterium]|nr:ABC transporter substrate-binding protein/permease [Bacillota bacterium]